MPSTPATRSLLAVPLLALTACMGQSEPTPDPAEADAAVMRLPVSLNEVMVAMVNNAADPIWLAAWRHPQSDDQWRALERNAAQIQIAGALLAVPGTGPLDDEWTGNPRWQFWSEELEKVGGNAAVAVANRDIDAISQVGDDLVAACEGCHIDFKLPEPTGGKFGELSPTEQDFK